jgi:metal-responsive CopG/Arc/MetJ family transcriptional regulator
MRKETISFSMEPSLIKQLDSWAKARKLTRSKAVRYLIRQGIGVKDDPYADE